MKKSEPRILGFLCNWCSYAGADLAGVSRFQYPPNLRVIRVMCSARVDPVMIIEAFLSKKDGVMVLGCHIGDCHYITGNLYTQRKIRLTHKIIGKTGMIPERLLLDWVSASEGERFARIVTEFTEKIREIGPLGEREGIERGELRRRLLAAKRALEGEKLRWLVGKELELTEKANVYNERIDQQKYDELMEENINNEYEQARIYLASEERPLSVKELSVQIGIPTERIIRHISLMLDAGAVTMVGEEEKTPTYTSL